MQSSDARDVRKNLALAALANLAALADAEWRVLEINEQIERQRHLIEELASQEHDIASAAVVLEGLHVRLSLAVRDRRRVYAELHHVGSVRSA